MGATKKASRYQKRQPLSENAFTTLHLGVDLKTGRPVLIRSFKPSLFTKENDWLVFRKQLDERRKIPSQGLLPVLGVSGSPTQPTLIIAGTSGRSLRNALTESFGIQEGLAALLPVAAALDNLHQQGFAHGDVRPETLFFTDANHLALNELATHYSLCGWHQQSQEMKTHLLGSVFPATHLAPEIQSGGVLSDRTDQYALGLVLLELCTGHTPQGGANPLDAFQGTNLPIERQTTWDQLRPVLQRALSPDPAARYSSCQEFLEHANRELNRAAPAKWILSGLALAVLLVVIVLGFQFVFPPSEPEQNEKWKETAQAEIAEAFRFDLPPLPVFNVPQQAAPNKNAKAQLLLDEARERDEKRQLDALREQLKAVRLAIHEAPPTKAERIPFFYSWDSSKSHSVTYVGNKDSWHVHLEFPEGLPKQRLEIQAELFDVDTLIPLARTDFSLGEPESVKSQEALTWNSDTQVLTIDLGVINPPKPEGWQLGKGICVRLMIVKNPDKPVLWKQSLAYHLGEFWNYNKKVALVPSEVPKEKKFQIATGIHLNLGQTFDVIATGKIQPGTKNKSQLLAKTNDRAEMGPSGLLLQKPQHLFVSDTNTENGKLSKVRWGALLMKVGESADWEWPDPLTPEGNINKTRTAARNGELYLSIDSVTHQYDPVTKRPQSVENDDFWQPESSGGGRFEVTIKATKIFPEDLPNEIENQVKKQVTQPTPN